MGQGPVSGRDILESTDVSFIFMFFPVLFDLAKLFEEPNRPPITDKTLPAIIFNNLLLVYSKFIIHLNNINVKISITFTYWIFLFNFLLIPFNVNIRKRISTIFS